MNPYLPYGAEDDRTAPWWDREETIEVYTCASECDTCDNEVEHKGDICAECLKYEAEHQ